MYSLCGQDSFCPAVFHTLEFLSQTSPGPRYCLFIATPRAPTRGSLRRALYNFLCVEYTCVGDRQSGRPGGWVVYLPTCPGRRKCHGPSPPNGHPNAIRLPRISLTDTGPDLRRNEIGDVENTISVHLVGFCEDM